MSWISTITRIWTIRLIKLYQKTLSPDHGPLKKVFPFLGCKYHPTCSNYSIEAIERFGLWKGGFKGVRRVLRCNPISEGGHDPVVKEVKE